MNFRAPEGFGSITLAGVEYRAEGGAVAIPQDVAGGQLALLASFGLTEIFEPTPAPKPARKAAAKVA